MSSTHAEMDDDATRSVRGELGEIEREDLAATELQRTELALTRSEARALLAARWTFVDHFERQGERYIVVRRNTPAPKGLDSLTQRERQALELAAAGHSNKSIAHEMQVAASTVAVLLYRAAKKLECKRGRLVATYERLCRDK